MKSRYIKDIAPGETLDDLFVLCEKNLSQKRDGSNFLNLTLGDKTGRIKGVMWDNVERIDSVSGDVVRVTGNVSEYRGNLQLVVKDMQSCEDSQTDPAHFIASTDRDGDQLFSGLTRLTDTITTPHLKQLIEAFWTDEAFVAAFKRSPAAKHMHHACIGGLLLHSYSVAKLADVVSRHYAGIDRDMLLAGAVLHDIGKIREIEVGAGIDYSDEGKLLAHIVIGVEMVTEKIRAIDDFPPESAMLLKHMIISHHGTREFGSPEVPKTIEAVLLNFIDDIDAKLSSIRDHVHSSGPNGGSWTSYHRMMGRHFFKTDTRGGDTDAS